VRTQGPLHGDGYTPGAAPQTAQRERAGTSSSSPASRRRSRRRTRWLRDSSSSPVEILRRRAEGQEEGRLSALDSTVRRSTHQAQRRAGGPLPPIAPRRSPRQVESGAVGYATDVGGVAGGGRGG
jgi:hypothetical protein